MNDVCLFASCRWRKCRQSSEQRPQILNVVFVTQQVNELHGPLAPSTAEA